MCGISGFIGKKEISNFTIRQTLNLMKNRGPDAKAFYKVFHKKENLKVYLLHTRLNIIDLDKRSNQPFTIGDLTIVFNGEIYNYLEIRNYLVSKGVKFKTKSDTEVLLQSYKFFGINFFDKIEGMWSFAIWDNKKKKLILSKDRFSEKPLHTYQNKDGIYFGSEIKYLKSLSKKKFKIDEGHLVRYLIQGYKSLYKFNSTFFKNVNNFPGSSYSIINKNLNMKFKKYWSLNYKPKKMTFSKAVKKSKKIILEQFQQKFRSDVPMAFCLSGGVDSNTIVSLAKKQFKLNTKTFSIIDKDDDFNESKNIMKTVKNLKTQHVNLSVKSKNSFKDLEKMIIYHEQPIITSNYFYHSYLLKLISKRGYKVVFSGTGADEIYSGYYDHTLQFLREVRQNKNFKNFLKYWQFGTAKYIRNKRFKDPFLYIKNPLFRDHIFEYSDIFSIYLKKNKRKFLKKFKEISFCKSLLRKRMLNELFAEGTRPILQADDANSMYYSIENRSPFLDKKLSEFIYTVPSKLLINKGFTKAILRSSMKGIVGNHILSDKEKSGFNISVNSMFDFNGKYMKNNILNKKNKIFKIIDRKFILSILGNKNSIKKYNKFIFSFINCSIFIKNF